MSLRRATPTADDTYRYREYLAEEVDASFIYHTFAELEQDERIADVYHRLALSEERHLALWRDELRKHGITNVPERPSLRARTLMWIAKRFGPELVLPLVQSQDTDIAHLYSEEEIAADAGLHEDEAAHARIFAAVSTATKGDGPLVAEGASQHRSLTGGNALRASVLGANDGLVSNLALVSGFAGADPGPETVVLAGIAGLFAGASSMALGEWISVTSSREFAVAQLTREAESLRRMPEVEQAELAVRYEAKGLSEDDARRLAAQVISDREQAIEAMAGEDMRRIPDEIGSPMIAAVASFVLFALGAIIPVLPFFVGSGATAIAVSALLSAFGLFALGAGITLLTSRHWGFSGLRQVALGLLAAAITFGIGTLIGDVTGIS